MKTYAIIGAAGYIAPRHMRAIQATGGKIIAACDPSDSVGILDSFGYDIPFFTHPYSLYALLREDKPDYLVICSPNNTHRLFAEDALDCGCNVICEKPLALSTKELNQLQQVEADTGHNIHPVLQLRYHSSILDVRTRIERAIPSQVFLSYHTPRGPWYDASWKGDGKRSGGILFNIGVHMFDYLLHLFGPVTDIGHCEYGPHKASGQLTLGSTHVDWALQISPPDPDKSSGDTARLIIIDGYPIDFTAGFADLHTSVYQEILAGRGLTSEDTRPAIKLIEYIKEQCTCPQ